MLRLIIAGILSLTALTLLPFNAAAFDSRLVQELIIKSGMRKQVEQIPQDVLEGIQQEQRLKQDPEMKAAEFEAAVESAFNPKRLEALLHEDIEKSLTTEELREVLNWLDSPLGKKLTLLEEKAASPAARQKLAHALQQLLKDPAAPERLKLLQRVEKALHSTDAAVDMILNIQIAIISAISTMTPAQPRPTFEQITEMVYKNRPQIQQLISQQVIGGFLYTYHGVSTGDLETYIAFIESPVGSKYHTVTMQAFSDALIQSSKNFGEAVGEMIAGQDNRPRI
jgi:hypothetical protein